FHLEHSAALPQPSPSLPPEQSTPRETEGERNPSPPPPPPPPELEEERGSARAAMDLLEIPLPNMFEQLLGKDEDTWPPEARFLVAAHYGNVRRLKEIARKLDRKGKAGEEATVAATTYRGMNALHAAVGGQGKLAACRYLVETVRMDVNMWDSSPSKKTPLEHAVDGNNLPALRYLLDHGADLTQEEDDGDTVLHHAARRGTTTNASLLLTFNTCCFISSHTHFCSGFPP
uniref:Uncharacterized protein n=1 Tax=Aegilops tauschii subsp. strangulata TaxID=200361 RepID=A0A453JGU8_AEGTS